MSKLLNFTLFWLGAFLSIFSIALAGEKDSISGYKRDEPWLVEEAIIFLENFFREKPQAEVLEFGSGASTIWLAKKTPNLHSIEHSTLYYAQNNELLRTEGCFSVDYRLCPSPYYEECYEFPDNYFDLIIVDGRDRIGCIIKAIPKLKPGGVLMLDNSERPNYHLVFFFMKGWQHVSCEQKGPDKFGFWYPGWKTDWWIKPAN